MRNDEFREKIIDQSREFYYRSCEKSNVNPLVMNRTSSEVGAKFVTLKNSNGESVKIRYTRSYLFFTIGNIEYSEKIKYSKKIIKTRYALMIESELFESFKEQSVTKNIPVNILIEDLIVKYLEEIGNPIHEEKIVKNS